MAHFAKIENDVVVQVLVVSDADEHRGAEFLANDLGLGGEWVQCSYNNNIRKQYPGIGFTYDRAGDVFVAPAPYPSWVLDQNHDWQPPAPCPANPSRWDDATGQWVAL